MITLQLNGTLVDFWIDTGADITVITPTTYKRIGNPPLLSAITSLKGPNCSSLSVRVHFRANLLDNNCNLKVEQDVYVVVKLEKYLLGQPAIKALKLVTES